MLLVDELVLVFDQDFVEEVRVVEVYQVICFNTLVYTVIVFSLITDVLLLIRGFSLRCFQLCDLAWAYLLPTISSGHWMWVGQVFSVNAYDLFLLSLLLLVGVRWLLLSGAVVDYVYLIANHDTCMSIRLWVLLLGLLARAAYFLRWAWLNRMVQRMLVPPLVWMMWLRRDCRWSHVLLVLYRQSIPARSLNCVMVANALLLSILFHLSESALVNTLY